jgi:hypothetical protein
MYLFFRDALDCVEYLFGNPLFAGHMDFCPTRLYRDAERTIRVYSEWMTGDVAWNMQVRFLTSTTPRMVLIERYQTFLPEGATLLGVTLSSDKTNITVMTGGRTAHPVLLSLANIHMDVCMKASSHAFVLLALLPCPTFIVKDRPTRSVLESRVVHLCLDIITEPLKLAAQAGRMMSDPCGFSRFCFTALASYIVDTPEAALIACVVSGFAPFRVLPFGCSCSFRTSFHWGQRITYLMGKC